MTFELQNECDLNPVKRVKLTVRLIPGITAILKPEDPREDLRDGRMGPPLESDVVILPPDRERMCGAAGCSASGSLERSFLVNFVAW